MTNPSPDPVLPWRHDGQDAEPARRYTSPAYPSLPETRYTSAPPLGGDPTKLDAAILAEMGSLLGEMGASTERGAIISLFNTVQAASIQVWMQHLPTLLGKIRGWNRARMLRLYQAIEHLPEAAPPPGLLSRLGGTGQPQPSLVDRTAVLREITKLLEENPVSH